MLGYVLVTLFFAITVLFFCWILLSYLYHATGGLSDKELKKLRFKSKVGFALAHFWKRISAAKDFPQESIKGELGNMTNTQDTEKHEAISIQEFRENKEREALQHRKKYRIKENM